jgi:hypothetical protein
MSEKVFIWSRITGMYRTGGGLFIDNNWSKNILDAKIFDYEEAKKFVRPEDRIEYHEVFGTNGLNLRTALLLAEKCGGCAIRTNQVIECAFYYEGKTVKCKIRNSKLDDGKWLHHAVEFLIEDILATDWQLVSSLESLTAGEENE